MVSEATNSTDSARHFLSAFALLAYSRTLSAEMGD